MIEIPVARNRINTGIFPFLKSVAKIKKIYEMELTYSWSG